ncbi:MAG: CBS domain-containing protein [Acidobacteria bacterium]|nr:CBS domain-containing protein [Acidobacteriota bacterium]
METVADIMTPDPLCVGMDMPLGKAMELCLEKRIRHLPVLDEQNRLAGLVTDRDIRFHISPRIGTISENNSDRESLRRPIHLIMVRGVVVTVPGMLLSEAAQLMLANRVGCLPVVDPERHVVGMLTTTDLIRYVSRIRP